MTFRTVTLAAVLAVTLSPAAISAAMAASYTLRLGTVLAPSDPLVVAAEGMKKAVEERTKGEVRVQIFPSSQLGDTQAMMDQAAAGAAVGTFRRSVARRGACAELQRAGRAYVFTNVDEIARFAEPTPSPNGTRLCAPRPA